MVSLQPTGLRTSLHFLVNDSLVEFLLIWCQSIDSTLKVHQIWKIMPFYFQVKREFFKRMVDGIHSWSLYCVRNEAWAKGWFTFRIKPWLLPKRFMEIKLGQSRAHRTDTNTLWLTHFHFNICIHSHFGWKIREEGAISRRIRFIS